MKLNARALALTAGLGWAAVMLIVGALNAAFPPYGQAFLDAISSLYPGFRPTGSPGSILIGAMYGLIDGLIGGAAIGWLYNALTRRLR